MPHITDAVDLGRAFDKWKHTDLGILQTLGYKSYYWQREYGMSHEDCQKIGLSRPGYLERYNKEKQQK